MEWEEDTGTGAAPIVARAAKEQGILTVGVVTKPFFFEGQHRMKIAEKGIEDLAKEVDAIIVIPNDKLLQISEKNTNFKDAFAFCDNVLRQAVEGISDLITTPGIINVDFADIRAIMSEAGSALMGIGLASGEKEQKMLHFKLLIPHYLKFLSMEQREFFLLYLEEMTLLYTKFKKRQK